MGKILKWGYIDTRGEWVVEPKFEDAWPFYEDVAAVRVEWARGYIGRTGEWVIEPRFQAAGPFRRGRAGVMLDDVWGFVDKNGAFTPDPAGKEAAQPDPEDTANPVLLDTGKYVDAGAYCEGLARVRTSAGGKWFYIREDGKAAFKGRFEGAKNFREGTAAVLVKL